MRTLGFWLGGAYELLSRIWRHPVTEMFVLVAAIVEIWMLLIIVEEVWR